MPPPVTAAIRRAQDAVRKAEAHHRAGRFGLAETQYLAALKAQPDLVAALLGLGGLRAQQGDTATALRLFGQAAAVDPADPTVQANLAQLLLAAGRFAAALVAFDAALAGGLAHPDLLAGRADALSALGRPAEALPAYDAALRLDPRRPEIWLNRGTTQRALGQAEAAMASYQQAIAQAPEWPDPAYNRGVVLAEQGRHAEALASFERACRLRPDFAAAHDSRGVALAALDRLAEALAAFDRCLACAPDHAPAHLNRGVTLLRLDRPEAALAALDRAVALAPDDADAWFARGNALRDLLRHADAVASFERAIRLRPDFADAHWNASHSRLVLGDFAAGLPEAEWRWQRTDADPPNCRSAAPPWRGEAPLAGRSILLFADGGFGDVLMFCRYVEVLKRQGARVLLEVAPPLRPLLAEMPEVTVLDDTADPPADVTCPLGSLPLACGTSLATIPASVPYLAVPADRLAAWRERLGPADGRPRIGLAWSGSVVDLRRRVPLAELLAALAGVEGTWHVVQRDIAETDRPLLAAGGVQDHSGELRDFADTAALLSLLDLTITIDTAAAHLAGALGRPVWVLLPYRPEWRWQLDRTDSPWYPTMRLFRQQRLDDWSAPLAAVAADLQAKAELSAPSAFSAGGKPE